MSKVMPPGQTILANIVENGMTQASFARKANLSAGFVSKLIVGKVNLTVPVARILGHEFKTEPIYWLKMERAYRRSLEASNA